MHIHSLRNEADLEAMRGLIRRLARTTLVDFEEVMRMPSVRETVRIWREGDAAAGFAYVDLYNNLWFEVDPAYGTGAIEDEMMRWGLQCVAPRGPEPLDSLCDASHLQRITALEKFGFVRAERRSLKFSRSLLGPLEIYALPAGFAVRPAAGEQEVEDLVALHRAAFGTDNMTVEQRLAIMQAPNYQPELDLIATAPAGTLAGFCMAGFEDGSARAGYADPIGIHPEYRKLGLGKALLSTALAALRQQGAVVAALGTSSQNTAMQRLALSLGFVLVGEGLCFSYPASRVELETGEQAVQ